MSDAFFGAGLGFPDGLPKPSRREGVLDPGIAPFVATLNNANIETFESCEGGEGHAVNEPTIWFYADQDEAFRALRVCQEVGIPAYKLSQSWLVIDGERGDPVWSLTFQRKADA